MPDGAIANIAAAAPVPGRPGRDGLPVRQWAVLDRLEIAAGAKPGAGGAVTASRRLFPCCILFGPYWRLPGGNYRLTFACRAGRPTMPDQPVLGVEVIALNRDQQAWRDFTAGELRSGWGAVDFEVPQTLSLESGEEARFEFRFFAFGNADLTVGAVQLRRLDQHEILPTLPRRWRLLGRLWRTELATSDRTGTVTPRLPGRASILACGGRPHLRLPEGHYRLTVRGTAGVARLPDRPIAAVEIAGLRDWPRPWNRHAAWRRETPAGERFALASAEFTTDALAADTAAIDFAVPYEASLEADSDTWFEIRLRDCGNAPLAIDALDIAELTGVEAGMAASLAAPAIHTARRRNVVVVGNCQADTICQGFQRAAPLRTRFSAKFQFVGLQKHLHDRGIAELRECDVLLVQDIRDWETYPLREFVPDGVEIVCFPLLHFASLWPFDHYNGPGDKEAYEREWPNLTFLYQDGLLARLRREIPDRETRFRAYRDLELPGIINYVRLHDFERRRLLAMDERFGGGIGRYVLDNFQAQQLFYTIAHPNRQVLSMLMQRLMQRLGIDEPFPHVAHFDHLKRLQVPIHPKVARALGVTWADEATRYLYEGRPTTWEAYTRAYIEHYG